MFVALEIETGSPWAGYGSIAFAAIGRGNACFAPSDLDFNVTGKSPGRTGVRAWLLAASNTLAPAEALAQHPALQP
jgi:hypothetical protein